MSNECSPDSANRVVTFTTTINSKTINSNAGGVAVTAPRVMVRRGVSRAALYLAHIDTSPRESMPESPEKSFWSSAFDFFVEGFANCGALYPTGYFNVGALGPEMDIPVRDAFAGNERRVTLTLVPNTGPGAGGGHHAANSLAMASQTFLDATNLSPRVNSSRAPSKRVLVERELTDSDVVPSREIERPNRWSWLRSCWETVVSLRAHLRREREIRQSIDALAVLDDLTLKDIGIHHRGMIEHAVRNVSHDS